MIRFIIEVVIPGLIVAWTIYATWENRRLKRMIKSLDTPEVMCSYRERRKRARKELQRRDEDAEQERFNRLMNNHMEERLKQHNDK
jgi:uncharacterized membrane protein YccC